MFDRPSDNLLGDWHDDQLDWTELCSARYIWERTTRPWSRHSDFDQHPGTYSDDYGHRRWFASDDDPADPFSETGSWYDESSW